MIFPEGYESDDIDEIDPNIYIDAQLYLTHAKKYIHGEELYITLKNQKVSLEYIDSLY